MSSLTLGPSTTQRKLADSYTRVNPATVVEIPFKNQQTNWEYNLYLWIEKLPPPQEAVQLVAPVSRVSRRLAVP